MSALGRIPDWIAVDWGTSSLRVWAMSDRGEVLAQDASERGMSTLQPAEFEAALLELVEPWLGEAEMPVISCGMVGARQGWCEARYGTVPCPPLGPPLTIAPTSDQRLNVQIIPGLSQMSPADVMRGEETQIAGFLAKRPDFDGVLVLPGTHTKWARISAQEIAGFQTVMTGEMFALISKQSVLRHSIPPVGHDDAAFDAAVLDAIGKPEALAARLFTLRAESLLSSPEPASLRARLSGLLIGAELAATRAWWLGQNIALIGEGSLSRLYARALAAQGVPTESVDVTSVTLAGLTAAYLQSRTL